jgi:tetratricopeptide (TPR) repeat protein
LPTVSHASPGRVTRHGWASTRTWSRNGSGGRNGRPRSTADCCAAFYKPPIDSSVSDPCRVIASSPTTRAASPWASQPARAFETPLDIAERTQWLSSSNSTDALLTRMDRFVHAVVEEYEASGPSALAPRVLHQRRAVETLLRGHQHPRHRRELLRTAARLSGLLGYMSVNLGRFPTAAAYCDEAFQLGSHAEDHEVQAWTRGADSLRAYYTGDYKLSVELAREGQRYAANGPQSIRLAINGEARALARLGDTRGTDEAVARAYRASERCTTPDGVSSCISFGPYSLARTASNAATAYVNLGNKRRVQEHVDQALPAFEASTSKWSQSLVRLDLANVLLLDKHPDVERAAALAQEALTISAGKPITSVLHRTREFLRHAAPYRQLTLARRRPREWSLARG